jgi:hypothetical protein
MHVRVEREGNNLKMTLRPKVSANLYLPNLNKRLKLIVRSTDIEDLPDIDPTERETSWLIGVARQAQHTRLGDFSARVGVRFDPIPMAKASLRWRKNFLAKPWYFFPKQKVFWRNDEGFGEMTILQIERGIGHQVSALSTSAAKITEETDGMEWDQSLIVAYFRDSNERKHRNRKHAIAIKGTIFGHMNGSDVVDLYRLQILWRYPLWRKWLFLDVVPGVDFENERDWNDKVWLRLGVEAFFDGPNGNAD